MEKKENSEMPIKTLVEHNPDKIRKGDDFYIENGLYVFTEKYLLERGYCCQNGCRHCPYSFKKDKTL